MKNKFLSFLLIAFSAIVLYSCSGGKASVPVPKDANVVVHIDAKSILSKLSWNEIKQTTWFKQLHLNLGDEFARQILDNPALSGIDIESDLYFFIKKTKDADYGCVTLPIKDEKKFNEFASKIAGKERITKDGNLSVIAEGDALGSWSSNRFVAVFSTSGFEPSTTEKKTTLSLVDCAKEVHGLKSKNSLADNKKFASLLSETGDLHFWLNGESLTDNLPREAKMLTKLPTLLKGNFTACTINFANGKITADLKNYLGKELSNLFKKQEIKNFNPELLKKIPSESIAGAFIATIPLKTIADVLALVGVDGLVNGLLTQTGLRMEDITKAFNGETVLAVSDFNTPRADNDYPNSSPNPKLIFATAIADKASFDKILGVAKKSLFQMSGMNDTILPYTIKDGWLVAGNDETQRNQFGATSTNHDFIGKISGHPMGAYLDLQKLMAMAPMPMSDSAIKEALTMWQELIIYGGEFNDNATKVHAEINLADKNTNSIKQISNLLDKAMTSQKRAVTIETELDEAMPTPKK